jgi:hypothetical protein
MLKGHVEAVFLGSEHDEAIIRDCEVAIVVNAYINGPTLKISELLMNLDKPMLAFPADPWRYSGKGANFLIQTGTAQPVTCEADIFSYLTSRVILEK